MQDRIGTGFSPSNPVLLVGIIPSMLHTHLSPILLSETLDNLTYCYPANACKSLV